MGRCVVLGMCNRALSTHDMTLLVDERSLLVHGRALLVVDTALLADYLLFW